MGTRKRKNKTWQFLLFIAGDTVKADFAVTNLKRICSSYIGDEYDIEVIDLLEHPELARQYQVLAVPTVLRKHPLPERRIIGDLSRTELVISGLELPSQTIKK